MIGMVSANGVRTEMDNAILDECIDRIADGYTDAMEMLYNYTRISVYAFAFSILKNAHDAEDVLHDCFVHVWQAAHTYRSHGKPLAWILTITKNLCLSKIRERGRISDVSQENWEAYISQREEFSPEDKLVIARCMMELTDKERRILVLHIISEFKYREIAELEEIPLATVLSKYHRAIKKLRKMLERNSND